MNGDTSSTNDETVAKAQEMPSDIVTQSQHSSGNQSSRAAQATQEQSVGITTFASGTTSELYCVFKQRYTDFQVNEILPSGEVLHLKEIVTPPNPKQKQEQEKSQKTGQKSEKEVTTEQDDLKNVQQQDELQIQQQDELKVQTSPLKRSAEDGQDDSAKRQKLDTESSTPPVQTTLSEEENNTLVTLFGESVTADALKLYNAILSHPDRKPKDHRIVKSDVIESKATRTQAHAAVRTIFKSRLETLTLQDEPGRMALRAAPPPTVQLQDKRTLTPGKKVRVSWEELGGDFLHFTLYKENKDTMEVLYFLASELKVSIKSFAFAGTKDRRGVTVQRVSAHRVQKERMIHISRSARGWKVGGFVYRKKGLELGGLTGNEFVITLRECQIPGTDALSTSEKQAQIEAHVTQAAKALGVNGYINFYGLQRFGTYESGTHTTGVKILQGDLKGAIDSILSYNPAYLPENITEETRGKVPRDDIDRADAIRIWNETYNASKCRNKMPRRFQAEMNIIQYLGRRADGDRLEKDWQGALMCIQRGLRLMYVHAYQSFIWNQAAVKRRELYGGQVAAGDLVIVGEKDAMPVKKEDNTDQDGEVVVHPNAGEEAGPEDDFMRARPLSEEEAASGQWDIFDIVLPLPGWDVILPANEIGKFYEDLMASEEGGRLDPHDMRRSWKDASLSGSYRRLMSRPLHGKVDAQTVLYTGEQQMAQTDADRLLKTEAAAEDTDGEQKVAVVLRMQLGSSQYATMALRELTRGGAIQYKPEFSVDRQRK